LAHQWFGNLVTMEWWDGLFLNEGFARFMEFAAVDALFPEWQIYDDFIQGVYLLAMNLDSMLTSHPVHVAVNDPDEIHDAFDAISYAKGASVIRMAEAFLGHELFMEGIRHYLTRHAYSNAQVEDLWTALSETSGKPLNDFMKSWTSQTGYPVLTVDDQLNITQKRFFAGGPWIAEALASTSTWPCLIDGHILSSDDQPSIPNQLTEIQQNIASMTKETGGWFKLNLGQFGFFRVNYSLTQWKELSNAIKPGGRLGSVDRLGLISDCFSLGKAGYLSITVPLELVSPSVHSKP
jgi:aminopeptidase N